MANENMQDWKASPAAVNETVFEVKRFLDAELAKASELEYLNTNIQVLFSGVKGDFKKAKSSGIGHGTILKFLGNNWKQWMVKDALDVLSDQQKIGGNDMKKLLRPDEAAAKLNMSVRSVYRL